VLKGSIGRAAPGYERRWKVSDQRTVVFRVPVKVGPPPILRSRVPALRANYGRDLPVRSAAWSTSRELTGFGL
jgi:hypothetical protein